MSEGKIRLNRRTRFCPRGHDKDAVGRYENRACKACAKISSVRWCAANPEKARVIRRKGEIRRHDQILDKRRVREGWERTLEEKKRYCAKGHDKDVVGRYGGGQCKLCSDTNAKAWSIKNPEARRRTLRKYNVVNWRNGRAARKRWSQANAHREAERARARYAKSPQLSMSVIEGVLSYYGEQCAYCGGDYEALDHLQALARGGVHAPENLAPACRRCNSKKKDRPIWVLMPVMGAQ